MNRKTPLDKIDHRFYGNVIEFCVRISGLLLSSMSCKNLIIIGEMDYFSR